VVRREYVRLVYGDYVVRSLICAISMEYQRLFKQVQAIKAKILDCDRDGISASGEVREAFLIVRSHYHAQFKLLDALLVEEVQRLFDKKRAQENVDT